MRVSFGDFVFDGETRELLRSGQKLRVPPKTFRMLELLLERRPNAVAKEDLVEALWPGVFVADGNLARVAAELRGIVGDDGQEPRVIRTVPRFGYAFQAEATDLPARTATGTIERRRRRPWIAAVGAGAGVVLLAGAFFEGRAVERSRHSAVSYRRLTFGRGLVGTARLTPDGATVVYAARWGGEPARVFLSRIGGPEAQSLDVPAPSDLFAMSRAGELAVGLRAPRFPRLGGPAATLATMPLVGGTPREVEEGVTSADFSPRGGLAVVRAGRLEFPAGKVLYGDGSVGKAVVSPAGDRIAVLEVRDGWSVVAVVDLDGKRRELARLAPALSAAAVVADHVGIAWNADGTEVLYAGGLPGRTNAIFAADLSGRTRTVLPTAEYASLRDVASDGRLLVAMGDLRSSVLVAGAGGRPHEAGWFAMSQAAGLTRDGASVLLNEFGEGGGREGVAYLRKTDGGPAVKVASGRLDSLSPDGAWAARARDGKAELVPTGLGEAWTLAEAGFSYEGVAWMPDGKRLLVSGRDSGRGVRLWTQETGGGPRRAVSTEGVSDRPCVSPDGALIAVQQPDGTWLYPVAGGERRAVAGATAADQVLTFTEDGRALFVADRWRFPVEVWRLDLASGRRELWKTIAPDDTAGICGFDLCMVPSGAWALNIHRWTNDLYLVDGAR